MKNLYSIIPALILFSCIHEDDSSFTQTISEGEKWGIEIGSSPADVFAQLEEIGGEKGFNDVAVVYRQPFSSPQEVEHHLNYYQAITMTNDNGRIERALIEFLEDKVTSISAGGALPEKVFQWPEDVSEEIAVRENDTVDVLYGKLLAIYQRPAYSNYKIVLPNKTLTKSFDPDMANYDEWAFSFSNEVKAGVGASSSVRLFFKSGRLDKIQHQYRENEIFN